MTKSSFELGGGVISVAIALSGVPSAQTTIRSNWPDEPANLFSAADAAYLSDGTTGEAIGDYRLRMSGLARVRLP